jgi:hypothetical protein
LDLLEDFGAGDFFAEDFRDEDLRAEDFFADDLRADFFADDLVDFLDDEALFDDFFAGTFAPARRAWESPIAIACLRLVTFLPNFPLRRLPFLRSCIVFLTFAWAFFPYFAIAQSPASAWMDGGTTIGLLRTPAWRDRSHR